MQSHNILAESENVEDKLALMRSGPLPKGTVRLAAGTQLSKYAKNISGQRFGKLKAIEPCAVDARKQLAWICQCDCGTLKIVRVNHLNPSGTQSCGCWKPDLRPTREESIAKFWSKVNKTGECWLWTGNRQTKHKTRNKGGYGTLTRTPVSRAKKKTIYAHRFSWELHFGEIPEGMFVCHHCDVVLCVRPDHLFLGTAADNNTDMTRKGRHWSPDYTGEKHPCALVTEVDVVEIRSLRASGVRRATVASLYGMSVSNVSAIANRQNWKHVK